MPFLLRATPRLDLADWSVRSEVNLTATGHSRDTPGQTLDATNQHNVLRSILHQGILRWLAKRSVLSWFDRGNQRAMDYVRARPDSGQKILPYAKSDSARRWGMILLVALSLAGFFFGLIGAAVALAIAAPIFWKLEHHFFFGPSTDDDPRDE